MQFTLKNITKNIMNVFDSINVNDEKSLKEAEIYNKKLDILVTKFKKYFNDDMTVASEYLKLLQIEYFLLTGFNDVFQEDYDIEALLYTYKNLIYNIDNANCYFFKNGYLRMILNVIVKNYQDIRFYDYTLFRAALNDIETADIIEKLHPNIDLDKKEALRQFKLNRKAENFINTDISYPLEFFLYLKYFYKNYQNKEIVKEYGKEKLKALKDNNYLLYKAIITLLVRFYYYYASNYQFSYQQTNSIDIDKVEATDLLHYINEVLNTEELINKIGLDYYLDLLLDSVFIYSVNGYNRLESSLTKEQKKVLEKLK